MVLYEGISHFFQSSFIRTPPYPHLVQLGHPHPLPVDVVHTEDEAEGVDWTDVLQVEHVEEEEAHCDLRDETSLFNSSISLCRDAMRALSFLIISAYVFMIPVVVSRVTRLRGIGVPLGNNHDHELMKSREIPTSSRTVE